MSRLKRAGWILVFLVGLPLAGVITSRTARWRDETRFRDQMEAVVLASQRARVHTQPLAELCAVPGAEEDDACRPLAPAALLEPLSIAVGVAGLALVGLIVAAGEAARADRALLVRLFRPGLWATAVWAIGLIAAHALVVVGTLAALTAGRGGPGALMAVMLIGALAGCWAVARSLFGIFGPGRIDVLGEVVAPADAPALWQLVEDVGARLGALRPDRIVAGLDVTFFVTESDVGTPGGTATGRTLFVSLPLSRILTVDELRAIIAHELGHFRGDDTAYSQRFAPIYRGTTRALGRLASVRGGARTIALLPAFAILGIFLDAFERAEKHHSRARELLADAAGVEATSARAVASGLVKAHAFAELWSAVVTSMQVDALAGHVGVRNDSRLFSEIVRSAAAPERLLRIDQRRTSHPTDSHPTLATRLAALDLDVAAVAADALQVEPAMPAASLFMEATAIEERLSTIHIGIAADWARRVRSSSRGT
jgi:Zn-dependent protease with chaperone function